MSTYKPEEGEGLSLTTHPKHFISWNTAFNTAIWGTAGGVAGSYLDIPTPYGRFNAFGIGTSVGVVGYLALVIYNIGLDGVIDDVKEKIVDVGGKVEPLDPGKLEAFRKKYGVSWIDAITRYLHEYPSEKKDSPGLRERFLLWLDQTYLNKKPTHSVTETKLEFQRRYGDEWQGQYSTAHLQYVIAHGKEDPKLNNLIPWIWEVYLPENPPINRPPAHEKARAAFIGGGIVSDNSSLLLLLGGTVVGELYDQPIWGAVVGTGLAILYKKRKRDDGPSFTESKKLRLTDEQSESIHNEISSIRSQLQNDNLTKERRSYLEKRLEELQTIYEELN